MEVRLTPRAARSEIVGPRGDALAVKVNAPPAEDRANAALRKLVAKAVGIAPGRVQVVRGHKSRNKFLRLEGIGAAQASKRLGQARAGLRDNGVEPGRSVVAGRAGPPGYASATLPPFMKRAIWLIPLTAALFAGCGGDDSAPETPVVTPTTQTPSKLSKEQFIREADGICAEVNAALGSISSTTSSSSSAGQRADLYEGMIERMQALGTPDDENGLDDVFSAGQDIVSAQRDAEQATQDGDDTALASAESDAAAAETTFSTAARSYGFEECGQGPTTPSTAPTAPATAAPTTPVAPVTTTPAPVAPAPSGGAGTDTGTAGGGTAGGGTGTGGTSGGSGGVGPG